MLKIILCAGISLCTTMAAACDVCGCAASSFSLGLLPGSNHHFIGIRTNVRMFRTTHPPLFGIQEPSSKELFTVTDLYGRWKINRRFQVIGVLPYVYNQQSTGESLRTIQGPGDVTVLGNYVFVSTTDSITRSIKQSGTVGLGIKLPTGASDNTETGNRNMLPGTGSTDFLATLNYSLQKGSWGYLTESSFSYKTANRDGYQFGHGWSTTHLAFYRWILSEDLRILPQLGMNLNHNRRDRIDGNVTDDSFNGGTLINGQATLAVIYRSWAISGTYYIPLYQQLGNGYVDLLSSFRISLNYFIQKQ